MAGENEQTALDRHTNAVSVDMSRAICPFFLLPEGFCLMTGTAADPTMDGRVVHFASVQSNNI